MPAVILWTQLCLRRPAGFGRTAARQIVDDEAGALGISNQRPDRFKATRGRFGALLSVKFSTVT
jgi:hypothetical protein